MILWKLLSFLSSARAHKLRWSYLKEMKSFASISAKKKMVWQCDCPAFLIIVCASKEWNLLLLLKHLTSLVRRWRCHHGTQGSWGWLHYFFMCASTCHVLLLTVSSIGSWQTIFSQKNLNCLLLLQQFWDRLWAHLEGNEDILFSLLHNQSCVSSVLMNMCKVQLDTDFLISGTAKEVHCFWLLAS